jgi:predicted RNase H-like nuclease (RuvC/YqgF family)
MSTLLELERMQQHVARLRRRIKNQTRYIKALEDYPDTAKRATDVLARDSEELRYALIQLEDLQRQAQQETDRTDTPSDSNSNVA